jgi:hypothetical protein
MILKPLTVFLDEKTAWPTFHCHKKRVQDVQELNQRERKNSRRKKVMLQRWTKSIWLAWSLQQVSCSCTSINSLGFCFFDEACEYSAEFWNMRVLRSFQMVHQVKCINNVQLFRLSVGSMLDEWSIQSCIWVVCAVGARARGKLAVDRIFCQSLMVTGQVASRCNAVSGSARQSTHAALWGQFFLAKQSAVWHLLNVASQAKMRHLRGASLLHIVSRKLNLRTA